MFGETQRNGKKMIVAYFTILSRHSPGGTEENHEKISAKIVGVSALTCT
jgi:hypothetical protein